MISTQKPLFALTAADLMSHTVVMVPEHMTLPAAARLLSQSHISGAPVVDDEGRCIGVLSASDFLHWVETGKGHSPPPRDAAATYSRAWQIVDPDTLPENEVRAHMTADPVLVAPATPVGELARKMLDAHIHRVIVVRPDNRPLGVVSSTDLLAALAHADEVRRLHESLPAAEEAARMESCGC
jgi:CBS domain-containing protein